MKIRPVLNKITVQRSKPMTARERPTGLVPIIVEPPRSQRREPYTPIAGSLALGEVPERLELSTNIVGEGAVDTRDRPRSAPLLKTTDELLRVDREMEQRIGTDQWGRLKEVADRWAGAIDRVANAARLPPEGIHPDFALAGLKLMRKGGSDAELAKVIASSQPGAAATAEVWLCQFGVGPEQAPAAFAELRAKLGELPSTLLDAIARARSGAVVDGELAEQLKALGPHQLLRAQHALALAGLVDDRLTFYGAVLRTERFPLTMQALLGRDVRRELLAPLLEKDTEYQALTAERDRLIAESDVPSDDIEWALLQDQKLCFVAVELSERGGMRALNERTIEETFFDHLRARREGDLEKDLQLNYDPHVFFTSNQGNFFGHDGVRQSAANLAKLVPGREWVMNRLSFIEGKSPTEGYATEVWSAELPGKLVTAVDNFYIKDGKILMQSAYYTHVREDLERKAMSATIERPACAAQVRGVTGRAVAMSGKQIFDSFEETLPVRVPREEAIRGLSQTPPSKVGVEGVQLGGTTRV